VTIEPHDEIPCPQCEGKGEVPNIPGHGTAWATCPTCKGRPITAAQVLACGWPPEVLEERAPTVVGKVAQILLTEED